MKGKKFLFYSLLFSFLLVGCSQNNSKVDVRVSETKKERSVKHESISLPLTYFKDSKYNNELGRNDIFQKNLLSVDLKGFDDDLETQFLTFYDSSVTRNIDGLKDNYKLLVLNVEKKLESKKGDTPLESFNLNKNSDLVIGDDNLSNKDNFIAKQIEFICNKTRVKQSLDKEGKMYIAIPKIYANDSNLQFKIMTNIDGEEKFSYINIK